MWMLAKGESQSSFSNGSTVAKSGSKLFNFGLYLYSFMRSVLMFKV